MNGHDHCARGLCTCRPHAPWEPYCSYACMVDAQLTAVQQAFIKQEEPPTFLGRLEVHVGDKIILNGPNGSRLKVIVTSEGFTLESWVGTVVDYAGRELI